MKTGVVLQIENNEAVIMLTGGSFISVTAKAGWKKGDVVAVNHRHFSMNNIFAAAACFVFVLMLGMGGFKLYYAPVSLISMDINPSIEMSLNRLDRIISVSGLNGDGADVLDSVSLRHKRYLAAVEELISSDALEPYLSGNEVDISIAVYSNIPKKSQNLAETLNNKVESMSRQDLVLIVTCEVVSGEFINEARAHDLTPGKYAEIIELQKLVPEIGIDDCREMNIKEIREIKRQAAKENDEEHHAEKNNGLIPDEDNQDENEDNTGQRNIDSGKKDDGAAKKGGSAVLKDESPANKDNGHGNNDDNRAENDNGSEKKDDIPAKKADAPAKKDDNQGNQENDTGKKEIDHDKKEDGSSGQDNDYGKKDDTSAKKDNDRSYKDDDQGKKDSGPAKKDDGSGSSKNAPANRDGGNNSKSSGHGNDQGENKNN